VCKIQKQSFIGQLNTFGMLGTFSCFCGPGRQGACGRRQAGLRARAGGHLSVREHAVKAGVGCASGWGSREITGQVIFAHRKGQISYQRAAQVSHSLRE
jgi:hypothetical protein